MSESNYSPKEDDQVSFLDYEGNMQSGTIQKVHSNGHSFTVSFRKPNGNLATHSIQRHQIKK